MTVHRYDHVDAIAFLAWFACGIVLLRTLIGIYRVLCFPL